MSSAPSDRPAVSVIVPVYMNAASLGELRRRVDASLATEDSYEIVFVDDGSPDGSVTVLNRLAAGDPGAQVIQLERNRGQHEAVLAGLRRARGDWLVILDADLQDPPEAIPLLLARAREGFDAVFAGRRGRYESRWRLLTSRLYKSAQAAVLGLPADASMFVVLRASAVESLLSFDGPPPQLVAMIGAAGLRTTSVPVRREPRAHGSSAYTTRSRFGSALRAMRWALWGARASASDTRRRSHNQAQRRYFEGRSKPNMVPRRSRYLERHVEQLIAFAGLGRGERVLEVGCGMGRYTLPLAARGLDVTGIDISPALLNRLRGYASPDHSFTLVEADVLAPPRELAGRFDAVVGFFVLHHLHDLEASLRSIADLLRPGGRVAFLEPNAYNPLYYLQIALVPTMSWAGDKGVARMRPRLLLRALRQAGFDDLRLERFGFFPPFVTERSRGMALERRFEQLRPLRPILPFQLIGARMAGRPSAAAQEPPTRAPARAGLR